MGAYKSHFKKGDRAEAGTRTEVINRAPYRSAKPAMLSSVKQKHASIQFRQLVDCGPAHIVLPGEKLRKANSVSTFNCTQLSDRKDGMQMQ